MNLLSSLAAEPALWAALPPLVVMAVLMVLGAARPMAIPVLRPLRIRRRPGR